MNILIIEDDKLTINMLQHSLQNLGHNTYVAETGEKAIEMLPNIKIDLLITDLMMPGISGLSLIYQLRAIYMIKTPIIIISSLNHKPLIDSAMKAGANDFLSKPISSEELEEKLKKFDKHLSF